MRLIHLVGCSVGLMAEEVCPIAYLGAFLYQIAYEEEYSVAFEVLQNNFYVDDCIIGTQTVEEDSKIYYQNSEERQYLEPTHLFLAKFSRTQAVS